jgi:hypothetical protein
MTDVTNNKEEWLEVTIFFVVLRNEFDFGPNGSIHLKFNLDKSQYTRCPIVQLQLQHFFGSVSMFVSNEEVPNENEYLVSQQLVKLTRQWYKPGWHRDTWWICPTFADFSWGWLYVTLKPGPPSASAHSLRWRWMTTGVLRDVFYH